MGIRYQDSSQPTVISYNKKADDRFLGQFLISGLDHRLLEFPNGSKSSGNGAGTVCHPSGEHLKILAILLLLSILYSLGSALYFMIKDKGDSTRMVKSLTIRVTLSLVLFMLMMLWVYIEYIHGN